MEVVGVVALVLAALCAVGYPLRAGLVRCHVPAAVSLMALGVCVGPSVLDWLPLDWLERRETLSKAAFVVLLLRAGLSLPPRGLRIVIVPALLFGTIPVAFELAALAGLSRTVFDRWDLCILAGFLVAAVSPAVILPTMLTQKDRGHGATRLIPDRIIGQTVVNAFVAQTGILLLIDVVTHDEDVIRTLTLLPATLLCGVLIGVAAGWLLRIDPILERPHSRGNASVAAFAALATAMAVYFGCEKLGLETVFATLALGVVLRRRLDRHEPRLRAELRRVWGVAEIVLFVNLGSQIELATLSEGTNVVLLLGIMTAALGVRLLVAHVLAHRTALTPHERTYTTVSHVPKATIQAVFGAVPLSAFLVSRPDLVSAGETLLVMAVLAIVITAPLGAVLLDRLGGSRLDRD
jgi:NhaP-type Na+/H+ or K+/H+ antiporter